MPVIVISGNTDDADTREALALGAHAVFAKPLNPGVLLEALNKAIDSIRA